MYHNIIHAPIDFPDKVLDIGCGTGIVTYHLSSLYPDAQHIYGVDLSVVPTRSNDLDEKFANLEFIQGDIHTLIGKDSRLGFGSADFVFNRMLICGITDWPFYVQKVMTLLRPGGWAEMQDLSYVWYRNGRVCSDEWAWMRARALREGARRKGLDMDAGRNLKRRMKEAGFVDVQTREYRIPYGTWQADEWPETRRIGRN